MLLTAEQHGSMVFHIMQNGYHQPFVDGKANRDKIEDEIVVGLYNQEIPPVNQMDVDIVCDLIDDMIMTFGGKDD